MMLVGFNRFHFNLFLFLCFLNASFGCKDCCCKKKTSDSQKTPDKSKSKGNKSTGSGNPDNPTIGHTPTGHGPTGHAPSSYDDKKLSDIVMSNMYKKVEPNGLTDEYKDAIFFALTIFTINKEDSNKVWEDIKKLFDEGKLVFYEMEVASGSQYQLFGYKEDLKRISPFCYLEPWPRTGMKELTNKIVAITIYGMDVIGLKTHQYINDDSLTASAVFPA